MSNGGASAMLAAMIEATKASGVVVRVDGRAFCEVVERMSAPLVVEATSGIFSKKFCYLTSYKGLAFFTKSPTPLVLPGDTELVRAGKIWVPEW